MSQKVIVDLSKDVYINLNATAGSPGLAGKNAENYIYGSTNSSSIYVTPTTSDASTALVPSGFAGGQGLKLIGNGGVDKSQQGSSVALSSDGNTMAIGGNADNTSVGAVWIYIRSGTTWVQQGNKLVGSGGVTYSQQGTSVALSSDGNTLAVGGQGDNSNVGATWIFTRSGTTWTQQGSKLVGTGAVLASQNCNQGGAVALSSDGNTLVVGGSRDSNFLGAVWVFVRSGTTWTQQGSKLVGNDSAGGIVFHGSSVAISSDGNTLALGGFGNNGYSGATWVFTRSGTTWTQQGSKLVGNDNAGAAYQGFSVSLSSNGNTLAIGGLSDASSLGATWIFKRSGTTWTQQGSKLVGSGNEGFSQQGTSVSLSSDGNMLAVGGYGDAINVGATWNFILSGTTWNQKGTKIVGSGSIGQSYQGSDVSLSGDGKTLVVGGYNDNSQNGATWVFEDIYSISSSLSIGRSSQGINSVAIGVNSGKTSQGTVVANTGLFSGGIKLVGSGGIGISNQGSSVALSRDGNTMAICGSHDGSYVGAVWIYIRSGTSWVQQGNKLVGSGSIGPSYQGSSVSLSSDGNTLALGGYGDNSNLGAVWIFTRSGTTWTQQGNKLVGSGYVGSSYQGSSVALSSDGNTLAVGGYYDASTLGATWIFTRSGTTWTQQGSKLVGYDAVNGTEGCYQGTAVALSSDGNTLATSAYRDNQLTGAVWVFGRSGTTWTQIQNKLVGSGNTGNAWQGASVALSSDGNTLAFGSYYDDSNNGAVWIFQRTTTTFSQQSTKLVGYGNIGRAYQGISISLSSDGNTLAIGGRYDNSNLGATWIFTRNGTKWKQKGNKIVGSGYSGTSVYQGTSVSLSGDGNTLAVGGYYDSNSMGATWVFSNSSLTGSSIALGNSAATYSQGSVSVAIGCQAGQYSQGSFSTALGNQAGQVYQPSNSFSLSTTNVRNINTAYNYCQYNSVTGEVSYCTTGYSSDSRLKKNISDINPTDMERILRELKIKNFKFIDQNMSKATFGIIANEVAKINNFGPQAIKSTDSFIPNIMTNVVIQKETDTIRLVLSPSISSPFFPSMKLHDVKKGDRIRFFTYTSDVIPTEDNKETYDYTDNQCEVVDVDDTSMTVLNVNKITETVAFLYGTFKKDVYIIEDPLNFLYVLTSNSQSLLTRSEKLDSSLTSMENYLKQV